MDLKQMYYINTVVECGNITKAARELFITQPSLSHIIAKTEQELGGRIFDRSTNPLTLTYAGERYMEKTRRILMLNQELIKEFRDISQNLKGRLRIGMPRERAAFMLPLILPKFKNQYPGIDIEIIEKNSEALREDVVKGRVDFIILPQQSLDSEFECKEIYEEELLFIAKKGTLSHSHLCPDNNVAIDLNQFDQAPFILLPKGHSTRDSIDLIFEAYGITPSTVLETTSSISAYRLAASGVGYAIVPRTTISLTNFPEAPEIYSLSEKPITWMIVALFRKDAYCGNVEKAFIEIAKSALIPYAIRNDITFMDTI